MNSSRLRVPLPKRLSSSQVPLMASHISTVRAVRSLVQHPSSFGPSALAGIDDERSLHQGHACQSARNHTNPLPSSEHEWEQIDMARGDTFIDTRGACRKRKRGLGDEALWICF